MCTFIYNKYIFSVQCIVYIAQLNIYWLKSKVYYLSLHPLYSWLKNRALLASSLLVVLIGTTKSWFFAFFFKPTCVLTSQNDQVLYLSTGIIKVPFELALRIPSNHRIGGWNITCVNICSVNCESKWNIIIKLFISMDQSLCITYYRRGGVRFWTTSHYKYILVLSILHIKSKYAAISSKSICKVFVYDIIND